MKYLMSLIACIFLISNAQAQNKNNREVIGVEAPAKPPRSTSIYTATEQTAAFPGGEKMLYKYLKDNTNYPEIAKKNGISGTVYIDFIVNVDGSIEQVKILRDIGGGCGAEAVRMVKQMPKWRPAKNNGKAVRSYFTLPVQFE